MNNAMSNVQVSIVIPVYNRADLLPGAVRSCLRQGVAVEVIVVDDGSREDVLGALRAHFAAELESGQVRYFRQENQGACVARNLGLEKAVGDYVKFLDSDDVLLPGALAQEVACFAEHDVEVVVTGWQEQRFAIDGKPIAGSERLVHAPELGRGVDDMLLGRGPWTAAALYKRSFVQGLRWDPAWYKAQDWGWSLIVCLAGARYVSLDIPSAIYKHHAGARITSDGDVLLRSMQARQYFLRMIEDSLNAQGALTPERRKLLAQYYYKDRIFLCESDPKAWDAVWWHIQELVPGFVPEESIRIAAWFHRVLGVRRGIRWYVGVKSWVKS